MQIGFKLKKSFNFSNGRHMHFAFNNWKNLGIIKQKPFKSCIIIFFITRTHQLVHQQNKTLNLVKILFHWFGIKLNYTHHNMQLMCARFCLKTKIFMNHLPNFVRVTWPKDSQQIVVAFTIFHWFNMLMPMEIIWVIKLFNNGGWKGLRCISHENRRYHRKEDYAKKREREEKLVIRNFRRKTVIRNFRRETRFLGGIVVLWCTLGRPSHNWIVALRLLRS